MNLIKSVNSFVYPVLRPVTLSDDFEQGQFSATSYALTTSEQGLVFSGKFDIEHDCIKELVSSSRAVCVVEFDCRAINYRKIFVFESLDFSFHLDEEYCPPDNVGYSLNFWVCLKDSLNYSPANMHPDYGNLRFNLDSASIIAIDSERREALQVSGRRSQNNRHRESMLKLVRNDEQPKRFGLDLSDDRTVKIKVPQEVFQPIKSRPEIEHLMALPALVEMLAKTYCMPDEDSEYYDKQWSKRLKDLIKAKTSMGDIGPESDLLNVASELLAMDRQYLLKITSLLELKDSALGEGEE